MLDKVSGKKIIAHLPFKARAPWWGGDLQTLRNTVLNRPAILPGEEVRLRFPANDGTGDILLGALNTPPTDPSGPLIMLIHGLTGCEDSLYVRESARFHLLRGRRVLRLNLRGAGPSRKLCCEYYHAGRSEDLVFVFEQLTGDVVRSGVFVVGFSLGGNILINFLAEHASHFPIRGAATVSSPIVPSQAAERIMAPRNFFYHRWLLNRMKKDCLGLRGTLSAEYADAILDAKSVFAFDNDFVAPCNGFKDAPDYYERTAGLSRLDNVCVPLLLVHAGDDPWIPPQPYADLIEASINDVEVALASGGGHVGFHGNDSDESWHDRMINAFLIQTLA